MHLNTPIRTVVDVDYYPTGERASNWQVYDSGGVDLNDGLTLSWPPPPAENSLYIAGIGTPSENDHTWVLSSIIDAAKEPTTEGPLGYELYISDSNGANLTRMNNQPPFAPSGRFVDGGPVRRFRGQPFSCGNGHIAFVGYEWDNYTPADLYADPIPATDADPSYPQRIVVMYSPDRGGTWIEVRDLLEKLKAAPESSEGAPRDFAADSVVQLVTTPSDDIWFTPDTYHLPTTAITVLEEYRSPSAPGLILMTFTSFVRDRVEGFFVSGDFTKVRYKVLWKNRKSLDICPVQNYLSPDRSVPVSFARAVYCGPNVHPIFGGE